MQNLLNNTLSSFQESSLSIYLQQIGKADSFSISAAGFGGFGSTDYFSPSFIKMSIHSVKKYAAPGSTALLDLQRNGKGRNLLWEFFVNRQQQHISYSSYFSADCLTICCKLYPKMQPSFSAFLQVMMSPDI